MTLTNLHDYFFFYFCIQIPFLFFMRASDGEGSEQGWERARAGPGRCRSDVAFRVFQIHFHSRVFHHVTDPQIHIFDSDV